METIQNGNDTKKENNIISGLAFIECKTDNPFELFKEWYSEVQTTDLVNPRALCFSTSTKDGKVSSRHLLLRRIDEDGFVIMTDKRSKKVKELTENPVGSIAFLWCYMKDGKNINKQVRIDGRVIELEKTNYEPLYNSEPLYCKLRSYVCHQGKIVDWSELKDTHDRLLEEVTHNGRVLEMPDHFIAYKVIPKMMEFYFAYDSLIGDRIMFLAKDSESKHWECTRIAS